jgi:formylglycine-generating enzyme required for sulfatase activity
VVVVPAGEFIMGSPMSEVGRDVTEGPQRKVAITRAFAAGRYEVTFAEWDACVASAACKRSPGDAGWGRGRRPAIFITSEEIKKEYLPWLARKTGKQYRLLSEAEWEYAARAGSTTRYSFGDTISAKQARLSEAKGGGAGKTAEVGSFPPNAFGLYDMHGNVRELVADSWHAYYRAPVDGSVQGGNSSHVLRGEQPARFRALGRSQLPKHLSQRALHQRDRLPRCQIAGALIAAGRFRPVACSITIATLAGYDGGRLRPTPPFACSEWDRQLGWRGVKISIVLQLHGGPDG